MTRFESFSSNVVPLAVNDIDTDQIIPARFLKTTTRDGLGVHLFADWRYLPDGSPKPDFVLNGERYRNAKILLAGDNFGCGSSREHAPWALVDFGFRAVVSTSFANIFSGNALKNGLLPIVVDPSTLEMLFSLAEKSPESRVAVDLAAQTLELPGGKKVGFPIDPFAKRCLIEGVDELGYILSLEARIAEYERAH